MLTKDQSMCRRVRLTEGLGFGLDLNTSHCDIPCDEMFAAIVADPSLHGGNDTFPIVAKR